MCELGITPTNTKTSERQSIQARPKAGAVRLASRQFTKVRSRFQCPVVARYILKKPTRRM